MARDENAVMGAVEQVCGLYGVKTTREQSRQFNVQGAAGRWRPMFFGTWVDDFGTTHYRGKADFLLRPRILITSVPAGMAAVRMPVPLWIECKSAKGKASLDQRAFAQWVQNNGDYYMLLREDVRPLMAWFDEHGVTKHCDDTALATVVNPLDASELYNLPCRWCGFSRDKHPKPAFGCPLHLASCNTKLIGKVWSPDLRKGIKNGKAATARGFGVDTIGN